MTRPLYELPSSVLFDIPSWLGRLMQVVDSLQRAKKSPDARKQDKTAPGDRGGEPGTRVGRQTRLRRARKPSDSAHKIALTASKSSRKSRFSSETLWRNAVWQVVSSLYTGKNYRLKCVLCLDMIAR